ncbi:hypothetical protein HAX54_042496 [Datura stramonium]|uniref:Uncharacterized protein n=1 Tax=Datura stramonium TaxID=4076 RepID=A0ABS8W1W3_DATST|nr:hypothetical protein [Datura stramonium]
MPIAKSHAPKTSMHRGPLPLNKGAGCKGEMEDTTERYGKIKQGLKGCNGGEDCRCRRSIESKLGVLSFLFPAMFSTAGQVAHFGAGYDQPSFRHAQSLKCWF